jgi:uncharacterized protein
MNMSTKIAPFVWHDLMTSDVAAAKLFYSKLIGWNMQSFDATTDYTVLSVGKTGMGGIMPIPPEASAQGMPPCWQGYIAVDDVDAYAAKVVATDGKIYKPPQDIPNVGRFAVAGDPFGAAFILFKPGSSEEMPPAQPGTQGLVGWNELHAGDGEKAFVFYSTLFGWTKTREMDMGPMGIYRLFATGKDEVGGMMTRPKEMPVSTWLYYFNVNGIDAAVARVNEGGGKVLMGPHQVPGGLWIAQCLDPHGAMFGMISVTR